MIAVAPRRYITGQFGGVDFASWYDVELHGTIFPSEYNNSF